MTLETKHYTDGSAARLGLDCDYVNPEDCGFRCTPDCCKYTPTQTTDYRQKRCRHGWTGDQCDICKEISKKDGEIDRLRALVTRLTDKLEDYTRDSDHGDSDLLAAIYCGRNFIYG